MVDSKVICLISGGIDSPVAAYIMIEKGMTPVALYIDCHPYTTPETKTAAINVIRLLSTYTNDKKIKTYIIPHRDNLKAILTQIPPKLTCVFCKRTMYAIAARIAKKEDALAIVTGEILGEQASQTTQNLYAINQAVKTPILRPLIGFDKEEVTRIGRRIGTLQASISQPQRCTAVPEKPETHAQFQEVLKLGNTIDLESTINKAISQATIISIQGD